MQYSTPTLITITDESRPSAIPFFGGGRKACCTGGPAGVLVPGTEASILFRPHPCRHDVLEGSIVHGANDDIYSLIHALGKWILEQPVERCNELVIRLTAAACRAPSPAYCGRRSARRKQLVRPAAG